jgi:hypothetical protein
MDALDSRLVKHSSKIVTWLEKQMPEAQKTLMSALQEGLAEYDQADRNDVWNVNACFWPQTGGFTFSSRDGSRSPSQSGTYSSHLLRPGDSSGILREVGLGHAYVVVMISMTPYVRAGHELSVHALIDALLTETQRVVELGLPISETTADLLSVWSPVQKQ